MFGFFKKKVRPPEPQPEPPRATRKAVIQPSGLDVVAGHLSLYCEGGGCIKIYLDGRELKNVAELHLHVPAGDVITADVTFYV